MEFERGEIRSSSGGPIHVLHVLVTNPIAATVVPRSGMIDAFCKITGESTDSLFFDLKDGRPLLSEPIHDGADGGAGRTVVSTSSCEQAFSAIP